MSTGRGRSGYVVLCAALLAVVLGTSAWSFAYVKSHADHRLVGVRWTLVALRSDRPVQLDWPGAELTFGKGGHLTASDGVNFMTGDYRASGGRLTMSVTTETAVGSGPSPVVAAMESLYMHPTSSGDGLSNVGGATSSYSIAGSRLVITTNEWTLTFRAAAS